jgi:hypothetical protein
MSLYALTMAPGLYWGDSAQLQLATAHPRLDIGARSYPLWTLHSAGFARLTGLPPDTTANLVSALWGAVAVGLCVLYVRRITGSALAGAVAAAALAVSHLHWSSSAVAEVYSAAAVFILLLLIASYAARDGDVRMAFAFGFVAGLSLLHHRMIQVSALAAFISLLPRWVTEERLRRALAAVFAGGLVGALPLVLFALLATAEGPLLVRLKASLLGPFRPSLPEGLGLGRGLLGLFVYEARFLLLNLAGPQLGLLVLGVVAVRRNPDVPLGQLAWVAAAGVLSPLVFPHFGDRYVLLLPAICVGCVLAGPGVWRFESGVVRGVLLLAVTAFPVAVYGYLSTSSTLRDLGFFRGASSEHRQAFLWPGKSGNRDAKELATEVLDHVPNGAVLLSTWGEGEAIRYVRTVDGRKPRVELKLRYHPEGLLPILHARPRARIFVSTYPHLPLDVAVPEGWRLEERIPRSLWELVPERLPRRQE